MVDVSEAGSSGGSSSSSAGGSSSSLPAGRCVLLTLGKGGERAKDAMGFVSWKALIQSDAPDTSITHRVGGRATAVFGTRTPSRTGWVGHHHAQGGWQGRCSFFNPRTPHTAGIRRVG